MKTIHKYTIPISDRIEFDTHQGSKIVKIGVQETTPFGHLSVWSVVDTDAPMENNTLHIRGTGHPFSNIPESAVFVESVIAGSFVWHVWAEK